MDTPGRTRYAPGVPRIDIAVPGIPQPLASYTPATRAGDLVFAAGHLASDFRQGVAPEARVDPAFPYYGSAIKKQTRYVLENLKKTFEAAGTSLSYVVKAQVFLTDLAYFNGFDEVWREYFPTPPPRTPDRHQRRPGPRLSRRGRPDVRDAERGPARRAVERRSAPGELLRGGGGGRSRLRGGPARQRFQVRRRARGARRPRVSVLRLRRQAPDALRP